MVKHDAVVVAPDVYRVLVENDRVRVLEVTGEPGGASAMHSHPDSVMHALSGGTIEVSTEDGQTDRFEIPGGATFWNAATTHSVKNVGSDTVTFIRVELK